MYATVSDILRDLLGINIPLPIQTFGFMMAISFVLAYIVMGAELKRKQANGLLKPIKVKQKFNEKITVVDYITATVIGAFIGFKLVEMALDYDALVENPQKFLLSAKGSWFGALLGGGYSFYEKRKDAAKLVGKKEEIREVTMQPYELMGNVIAIGAVGGLLGAKIFHNLENLDELMADPIGSLISFSGLTFYGGLIVAAIGIIYYMNKNGIPAWHTCDSAAAALMLTYGTGRIGCQLSGDGDWGIDNLAAKPDWLSFLPDWAWAYRYPNNVLNEGIPIPGCEGMHCNQLINPVYPTALYEAVACILLFVILWLVRKRFTIPGTFFLVYLLLNGIERFMIEKIRVNTTYTIIGKHITQAELISSVFVLGSIIGLVILVSKHKKNLA